MNRRGLLKMLAALPLLAVLKPAVPEYAVPRLPQTVTTSRGYYCQGEIYLNNTRYYGHGNINVDAAPDANGAGVIILTDEYAFAENKSGTSGRGVPV